MAKEYDNNKRLETLEKMTAETKDDRVRHFQREIRSLNLRKSIKASRILMESMDKSHGFERHDGRDYFVHPIAVAQTFLDNGVFENIYQEDKELADNIVTVALLHDIIEDVEGYDYNRVFKLFGKEVADSVDNVTKRDGEPMEEYVERVSSNRISAMVKILGRVNNNSTMANSSLKHRVRQLQETRDWYIPLTKIYRREYWEDGKYYFQMRTIMVALMNEVERCNIAEQKLEDIEDMVYKLRADNLSKEQHEHYIQEILSKIKE